jgi:hypothetical protein
MPRHPGDDDRAQDIASSPRVVVEDDVELLFDDPAGGERLPALRMSARASTELRECMEETARHSWGAHSRLVTRR